MKLSWLLSLPNRKVSAAFSYSNIVYWSPVTSFAKEVMCLSQVVSLSVCKLDYLNSCECIVTKVYVRSGPWGMMHLADNTKIVLSHILQIGEKVKK